MNGGVSDARLEQSAFVRVVRRLAGHLGNVVVEAACPVAK